jgi:hypothetical protein
MACPTVYIARIFSKRSASSPSQDGEITPGIADYPTFGVGHVTGVRVLVRKTPKKAAVPVLQTEQFISVGFSVRKACVFRTPGHRGEAVNSAGVHYFRAIVAKDCPF